MASAIRPAYPARHLAASSGPDERNSPGLTTARYSAAGLSALGLCLLWSYWPTMANMADRWSHNPQYSHGFLVPVFAAVVLWHRRAALPLTFAPSWNGLALLLVGLALRLAGAYSGIAALDAFSLLPTLAGLSWLVGGWSTLRWTWPAIAFLVFMLPLPYVAETALAQPLQRMATTASTYLLQTAGLPALAEGNIICIDDIKLGVIGACNGLGMLMTFFALSTAVAAVVPRRLPDKLTIVISAIPIALIANVARITATGMVHYTWGQEAGNLLHDWAGWLMMPLALTLLWLELLFLNRVLVEAELPGPLPMVLTSAVSSNFGGPLT